jgi:DNA-binding transcriptional LysR family regulator
MMARRAGGVQDLVVEPMVMDVHVRDLRYFLAVAEEGNVTQASRRLFVSQPALSKQIRALERQAGADLFARGRDGMRLTRAGESLVPHARRIVDDWQAAKAALARSGDCTLVLGMHTSPGRGLLPAVRARLVGSCPGAALELRHVPWNDPTGGLGAGESDAAFVWLPLPQPPYRWVSIAREPRLVAMADDHPLAGRESVVMADLLDEPFLALPESAGPLRDHFLAVDARDGNPPIVAAEIAGAEETYEAVASGIGLCLLAAGNAPILARGGVTMLPVRDLGPSELVLAWHERHCPPLLETFAAICREVVGAREGAAA